MAYVFAFLSLFLNGTHPVMFKISPVQNAGVSPLIFNFYFSIGACLSSFVVYLVLIGKGETVEYTPAGIGSGAFLVLACALSFTAVQHIGLARGQGIWCGSAILVSFVAGCVVQGPPSKPALAAVGLVLLLIGVFGTAFCNEIAARIWGSEHDSKLSVNEAPLLPQSTADTGEENEIKKGSFMIGTLCALGVGIFGGTIALWAQFKGIPENATDIKWLPSFASGVAIAAPFSLILPYSIENEVRWHVRAGLLPGIIGGTLWNGANLASLYAIDELGYAVAYPIMQSSLIVAALWGVLLFKELKGCKVLSVLATSGLLVIGGASLLAIQKNNV